VANDFAVAVCFGVETTLQEELRFLSSGRFWLLFVYC